MKRYDTIDRLIVINDNRWFCWAEIWWRNSGGGGPDGAIRRLTSRRMMRWVARPLREFPREVGLHANHPWSKPGTDEGKSDQIRRDCRTESQTFVAHDFRR